MPAFSRSLRSLEADGHGRALALALVAAVFLGAWGAWFALARVPVRATTPSGRVVVDRAVFPVHAAVAGTVAAAPGLELGRKVAKGELLVQLDDAEERLSLDVERARSEGLEGERAAIERRLAALRAARGEAREAGRAARDEAGARLAELELAAQLGEEEHERLRELHRKGGVSELELSRARIEAQRSRTAVQGQRYSQERLEFDLRGAERTRDAEIAALERDLGAVEGGLATARASLARLEHVLALKAVRAPADGELAEVDPVGPGAWLEPGGRVASIVSDSGLLVVAQFPPEVALGRIRRGQSATLRFQGFAWSRYGVVPARVEEVGREARDGAIRVELSVDPQAETDIPLQHGLLCSVEVDVDRVSPAELVLRAVGKDVARAPR